MSSEGVHTDPKNIQAVSYLKEPANVEQVRSFLGLAGYYRRFLPNFAAISSPLVHLTKRFPNFYGQRSSNMRSPY